MEGLLLLREAVGSERRPLSWRVGPQGVERPERPAQRDRRRAEWTAVERLRSPDEV